MNLSKNMEYFLSELRKDPKMLPLLAPGFEVMIEHVKQREAKDRAMSDDEYNRLEAKWDKALEDVLVEMVSVPNSRGLQWMVSTRPIIQAYNDVINQIREARGLSTLPNPGANKMCGQA